MVLAGLSICEPVGAGWGRGGAAEDSPIRLFKKPP